MSKTKTFPSEYLNPFNKQKDMEIVTHKTLDSLKQKANELNVEIFESDISFSFRIFENKQTKEFHQFFK